MSASPSGPPGSTPNGGPPAFRRKPKANPLITRPKAGQRPPSAARPRPKPNTATPPAAQPNGASSSQPVVKDEPDVKFRDFPIFTTKRAVLKGLRHHVMRLQSNQAVDPTDQDEWTRPVRLHRRDLHAIVPGGEPMDVDTKESVEAEQERERIEAIKAERKRIREENLAQIAPSVKTQKLQNTRRKATAVSAYELNETPEQQKRSQLRYEEAIPWHLEDFDNQHTWRGAYEGGLAEQFIAMVREPGVAQQSRYRVVPVEKFYKFREVGKIKTMSYDEAEAEMKKKYKGPRFVQEAEEEIAASKQRTKESQRGRGFVVSRPERQRVVDQTIEAENDHDFDFDMKQDFDDDDEGDLFGDDEETSKQAEDAIFKEQRQANVFGLTDEQEVEKEEQARRKTEMRQKQLEKQLRKALWKKERNNAYLEDEEGNPYFASSDSDDSEEEERKLAEAEAAKKVAGEGDSKGKDADRPSGTNTGSNTPSGRASKHGDPLGAAASLKRPGSPNLSDASDSESVRKRLKQNHMSAQQSTTRIPSRPHSPRSTSVAASRAGAAASGSDSETTDGGRRKISKLQHPSRTATPIGSRASSPAPSAARAASPEKRAIPTVDDIRNAIPPEGIALKGLLEVFRGRISSDQQSEFIKRVKSVTTFNSQTKTLFAKRA